MRSKKRNVGFTILGKNKGKEKYTMEQLKDKLEIRDQQMRNHKIMSFEELYQLYLNYKEMAEDDLKSSMHDPGSPRDSDSQMSMTPKSMMDSMSRRSFFKEQPGSTTHAGSNRMDLGTPKGEFKMFDGQSLPMDARRSTAIA